MFTTLIQFFCGGSAPQAVDAPWVERFSDAGKTTVCVLTTDQGCHFPAGLYITLDGANWRLALASQVFNSLLAAGNSFTVYASLAAPVSVFGSVYRSGAKVNTNTIAADSGIWVVAQPVSWDSSLVANNQGATLFLAADSILTQSFDPPNSAFGATAGKGSYYDASSVKNVGITNIYAENPCRFKFRVAHNLVTGDEIFLDELPSNHPLSSRRWTVTVTASDEVTIPVDASSIAAFSSGGTTSDAMAYVDMSYGNYGPLSWMLSELGYPFSKIDGVCRPGATSAQLAATVGTQWGVGSYTHGILHIGRNDASYDPTSLAILRDAMLAKCKWVLVCIPYPDAASAGYTAASLAKLKSIASFWYAAQSAYPSIKVCDMFGVISDPTAALEAALPNVLASDNVHPRANGARLLGEKMAADFPPISVPRRVLSRVSSGSDNLLNSGRFTALTGGVVGSGITGSVVAGWTIGSRSSANVSGGYAQGCNTPAIQRRNTVVYASGDILDVGDGWWYIVKTGGTTASALPAAYASAVLYDSTTGVTDGSVVSFRVPKWTDSRDRISWQYQNLQITADGGSESLSMLQSIALPGSVVVGDYIRAQADFAILGGFTKGVTLRLAIQDGSTAQLARAHGLAINGLLSQGVSAPVKVKTVQTPKIRVPSGAATLEARITTFIGLEGVQFVTALGIAEETTAPGLLA